MFVVPKLVPAHPTGQFVVHKVLVAEPAALFKEGWRNTMTPLSMINTYMSVCFTNCFQCFMYVISIDNEKS